MELLKDLKKAGRKLNKNILITLIIPHHSQVVVTGTNSALLVLSGKVRRVGRVFFVTMLMGLCLKPSQVGFTFPHSLGP